MTATSAQHPEPDAGAAHAQPGGRPWGQSPHIVQQLWFAVLRHEWRSLAVVPVAPGSSGLEVANALSEIGGIHRRAPLVVFESLKLELKQVASMLQELSAEAQEEGRALVALDSPLSNLSGVPIARAADRVLLVIDLGKTDLASAREVMDLVGRDKVIGAVVIGGGDA